ncbi:MAG: hypothetical protein U0237_03040 [Thermoleophilia bacterium]
MRVGYAGSPATLESPSRTLRLGRVTDDRLRVRIAANLLALEVILEWNAANGIVVYRVPSGVIPYGSHPANRLPWWDEFSVWFGRLGDMARAEGMRLSTHPGQYTVLPSRDPSVAAAAVAEVVYNDRLLECLGCGPEHKIVLHVGAGTPGDAAVEDRLAAAVDRLPPSARSRLVLENDERWPLDAVAAIGRRLGLPVVFDVFHHRLMPSAEPLTPREGALLAMETWTPGDGRPEVHFSTQAEGRRRGAHADALDEAAFTAFAAQVGDLPVDCVVETKDKERSALAAQRVLDGLAEARSGHDHALPREGR